MPRSLRTSRSIGLAFSRRWVKRRRIVATVGTTSGPTPSITTSAWPSSSDMTPVALPTRRRCSSVWNSSASDSSISPRTARPTCSSTWVIDSESVWSRNSWTMPRRWSRSHGLAVNWTRWVSSWRQTHRRKSAGTTSSLRSICTMLGATSSRRPGSPPGPVQNGSNCPSTRLETSASTAPSSAPLTAPPTRRTSGLLRSSSLSSAGPSSPENDPRLASIHRGRSTTRIGVASVGADRPVNSRTGPCDRMAATRSSSTISAASPGETSGPGRLRRAPVLRASRQSIMPLNLRSRAKVRCADANRVRPRSGTSRAMPRRRRPPPARRARGSRRPGRP